VPPEVALGAAGGGTDVTVADRGRTTEQARYLPKAGKEQWLDKMAAMFAGA
jgi:hypothetical protein